MQDFRSVGIPPPILRCQFNPQLSNTRFLTTTAQATAADKGLGVSALNNSKLKIHPRRLSRPCLKERKKLTGMLRCRVLYSIELMRSRITVIGLKRIEIRVIEITEQKSSCRYLHLYFLHKPMRQTSTWITGFAACRN